MARSGTGGVVAICLGRRALPTDDVTDREVEALLLGEELTANAYGAGGDEEDFTAFFDQEADLCDVWECVWE